MGLKKLKIKSTNKTLREVFKARASNNKKINACKDKAFVPPKLIQHDYIAPAEQADTALAGTIEVLSAAGMLHYFTVCRKNDEERSKRVIQRCALFIVWSYHAKHLVQITVTVESVTSWFVDIMLENYGLLMHFGEYLIHQKRFQPSTVRSYTSDIEQCFVWGTLFAPPSMKQPLHACAGIRAVADIVRANQAGQHRSSQSHRTWDEAVQQRKVPAGGLPALQGAVVAELPWARSIRRSEMDDTAYRRFMQLLIAAVYVFSANGRQSGVADVRCGQVEELLGKGYATSTKFKTNKKFGYQPITLSNTSMELVRLYVDVVRPQVCRSRLVQPTDHLWLTYKGEPDLHIGKQVTYFFIRTLEVSVTTTTIRSLVETTMDKRWKEGQITEAQKDAVQNINGHSSQTTRDYYLLEDRAQDVVDAHAAFGSTLTPAPLPSCERQHCYAAEVLDDLVSHMSDDELLLTPEPTPASIAATLQPLPLPLSLASVWPSPKSLPASPNPGAPPPVAPPPPPLAACWTTSLQPVTLDWGSKHPDKDSTKPTAEWTFEEKDYLGKWFAQYRVQFPDSQNVAANCLKHIRTDPHAVAIFHKHHTLNSARLRNGHRQYISEKQREEKMRVLRTMTELVVDVHY